MSPRQRPAQFQSYFRYGGDPVSDNLVASLNRPGGNVTGVTFIGTTLAAKKLELLREIASEVTNFFGLLVNPTGTLAEIQIKDVRDAIQVLGQRLHVANVSSGSEIEGAFATMSSLKVGALLVGTDPIFPLYRDQLVALAARFKISDGLQHRPILQGRRPNELWRQHL